MPNWNRDEFFTWLDKFLRDKGWSDYKLAQASKIAPSVISKARNDVQSPGWDVSVSMAEALGIPPEEMLYRVGLLPRPHKHVPGQIEWDALYDKLSVEDREELITMARMKAERRRGKK